MIIAIIFTIYLTIGTLLTFVNWEDLIDEVNMSMRYRQDGTKKKIAFWLTLWLCAVLITLAWPVCFRL